MNNNDWDFENDLKIDEKMFKEFKELTEMVKEQIDPDHREKVFAVNPPKIKAFVYVYKVMLYLTQKTAAKVSYEIYGWCVNTGCISMTGKELKFDNSELFLKAAGLASSFNVYQRADGGVRIDFRFKELTVPIR